MAVSEKTKTIESKIKHKKAQYKLDRQAAKTAALSSGNVSKYEYLSGKDVLPEEDLLYKAATIKRFEYKQLGSELKKQTDNAKDQYKLLKDQKHWLLMITEKKIKVMKVMKVIFISFNIASKHLRQY